MARRHEPELTGYESVGPKEYLDRFLAEYRLAEDDVRDRIQSVTPPPYLFGGTPEPEYLVHESLLRSHGDFPCAGDEKALAFCRGIAEEMVRAYGIPHDEAVARINRHWSDPGPSDRTPRIWIVGLDIVYHETRGYWAANIYYDPDTPWWRPGAHLRPLPPP